MPRAFPETRRPNRDGPDFLGRGWHFPPRFDLVAGAEGRMQGEARMVEARADIEQSLEILLYTLLGERIMRPTYGVGLQTHVFDPTNETSLTFLRSKIEKAIVFFEDRIRVDEIRFDTRDVADGVLGIAIGYTIPSTNARGNKVFPFYFREGTSLSDDAATRAAIGQGP